MSCAIQKCTRGCTEVSGPTALTTNKTSTCSLFKNLVKTIFAPTPKSPPTSSHCHSVSPHQFSSSGKVTARFRFFTNQNLLIYAACVDHGVNSRAWTWVSSDIRKCTRGCIEVSGPTALTTNKTSTCSLFKNHIKTIFAIWLCLSLEVSPHLQSLPFCLTTPILFLR